MLGKVVLGKYRLLRHLGSGSNAAVYLAETLDKISPQVVVKLVHEQVTKHPRFRQLFEAEVHSMANFRHPYAVQLIDASLDDPIGACLVMEYVPGVTLELLLRLHKKLPPERVARLMAYLGHALQAAHQVGIIHRDLKPANLMVLDAGQPNESLKVMDFGFAGFAAKPHIQLAELTGHGPIHAIGTPGYISPEVIRGDPIDSRSDLYSVGVILFELLIGRLPFEHNTQEDLLTAHVKESPPRFHKIGNATISPAVEGVVQLALAKYPNERQQDAMEIAESLARAVGNPELYESTAPADWQLDDSSTIVQSAAIDAGSQIAQNSDPFRITEEFEVSMPERMAAAKLRGFVEDFSGLVVTSEPGMILLRIGVPTGYRPSTNRGSGLFGWISAMRQPSVSRGHEPIEVELQMEKPDPTLARLRVAVALRPMKEYRPSNLAVWRQRCDKLHSVLRQYLGA